MTEYVINCINNDKDAKLMKDLTIESRLCCLEAYNEFFGKNFGHSPRNPENIQFLMTEVRVLEDMWALDLHLIVSKFSEKAKPLIEEYKEKHPELFEEQKKERYRKILKDWGFPEENLVEYLEENEKLTEDVIKNKGDMMDLDCMVAVSKALDREISYSEYSKINGTDMFDDMGLFNVTEEHKEILEAILDDKVKCWDDVTQDKETDDIER